MEMISDMTLKNILNKLDQKELYDLAINLGYSKINVNASKEFVINKLLLKKDELISNEVFSKYALFDLEKIQNSVIDLFKHLTSENLDAILNEFDIKDKNIYKKSKKEKSYYILNNYKIIDVLNSKAIKNILKPEPVGRNELNKILKELKTIDGRNNDYIQMQEKIIYDQEEINNKINNLESYIKQEINYLKNYYMNLGMLDGDLINKLYNTTMKYDNIDSENLYNFIQDMKNDILYDAPKLINGFLISIIFNLYDNIKQIGLLPSDSLFWSTVENQFNLIKNMSGRAEIPELRNKVCLKLRISEDYFDNKIEQGWKEGKVRLDIGSPIGRKNVKYLRTTDDNMYFYITLR